MSPTVGEKNIPGQVRLSRFEEHNLTQKLTKNNQVMTTLVNPTYDSEAGSPSDRVNANRPLSMSDVTDILENELRCLNEKLGKTLKSNNSSNNNTTTETASPVRTTSSTAAPARTTTTTTTPKSRTKYASTNFTSMGIGNPLENLPGFDPDEDLPEEEDDGRLTLADDNILREMNKKKAEQMFADIDFIDDDDDDEIDEDEEGEDGDDSSDKPPETDEKTDKDSDDKKLKDPDADVASPSDHVIGNKLRGFLNYYADFEALARARAEEDDTASLNGSVSDSESESREGLYEPPQNPPPFDSGPSTMEDDSTDDCESTYAMLYKSFSLRSQEEGYHNKLAISPTAVQPDHGYASETSADDRMSPIKRPGLLSKDGLKNSLAVLTEDAKNGTEIQTKLQQMSPDVEPESGIEVTPEPKGEPHLIDLGKSSQKTLLTKPTSLPPGWREVADTHGTYYWHIPSGTTQWTPPEDSLELSGTPPKKPARMPDNKDVEDGECDPSLKEFQQSTLRYASLKLAPGVPERREGRSLSVQNPKGIRFHVRSLGWVEMEDSDLSPGKSSLAVNNCIRQLSYRKTDIRDVAGIWGEGKDMYMVLEDEYLKLTDTNDNTVLNSQHVCSIRVWGVGRDNGRERDFAYVARDKVTRRYKCHVFRCDIPAKTIANALHEICAKVMSERQKGNTISMVTQGQMIRQQQQQQLMQMKSISLDSSKETNANAVDFPTPKAEPITVFRANYIGSTEVSCSGGMETLNDAINKVFDMTPADQWKPVRIEVAVSTVTVTSVRTKEVITENRIRFLSFLGIGPDIRQFGYIMCVGKNKFQCHVFCCEHSAGGLAKAIEAACKLRYQKCLDARPKNNFLTADCGDGKTWGCALKSGVQSLFSRFTLFKTPPEATVSAV